MQFRIGLLVRHAQAMHLADVAGQAGRFQLGAQRPQSGFEVDLRLDAAACFGALLGGLALAALLARPLPVVLRLPVGLARPRLT